MNSVSFKREPEGVFYLRLRSSCGASQPQLSHPSATLQPRVPKATGQGISIRASAPYNEHVVKLLLGSKAEVGAQGKYRSAHVLATSSCATHSLRPRMVTRLRLNFEIDNY
jgi:hypothetical protein